MSCSDEKQNMKCGYASPQAAARDGAREHVLFVTCAALRAGAHDMYLLCNYYV
jgi:hypothetical protein